jgi:beta-1,2-mannobiose phosphorylase / 1,2-beta-oligomannan phosphorylase
VVIGRTIEPILRPEMEYEKNGEMPNVVFSCGQTVQKGKLFIYYGGADSVTCVATVSLSWLLGILAPKVLEHYV